MSESKYNKHCTETEFVTMLYKSIKKTIEEKHADVAMYFDVATKQEMWAQAVRVLTTIATHKTNGLK